MTAVPQASPQPSAPRPSPPRWVLYARLLRLHRPIGTLLLLWPTLWALFLAADGLPPGYELFAFCAGTLLMRSAGCAINDWADRDFDRHVKRTADRPLTGSEVDFLKFIKKWGKKIALVVNKCDLLRSEADAEAVAAYGNVLVIVCGGATATLEQIRAWRAAC